jgi:hypothetical protein
MFSVHRWNGKAFQGLMDFFHRTEGEWMNATCEDTQLQHTLASGDAS